VLEDLEEHDIDRDVARVQVGHDALGGGVELGGHDDDLVRVVQRLFIERDAEPLLEGRTQATALREPVVDLDDAVGRQLRHPRRIVQRLGDDLARCAVALELDEHQGAVGRDGQQIDAPAVAGDLLPADQHPLARQDRRLADDHVFELLLAGELGGGQQGGLLADLPDGVLDGHGQCWGELEDSWKSAPDNKHRVKWLMCMDFSASCASLSPCGDNKPDSSPRDPPRPQATCGWAAVCPCKHPLHNCLHDSLRGLRDAPPEPVCGLPWIDALSNLCLLEASENN
jgi:hypothetical protein